MNLILDASLSEPPTDSLCLRYVTLVASEQFHFDCLMETEQEMKDLYYHYLLKQGVMDYIEQIITPSEHVLGLRLGERVSKSPAIKLKVVQPANVVNLIGLIKGCVYGIS
jgi:hypothetical protein